MVSALLQDEARHVLDHAGRQRQTGIAVGGDIGRRIGGRSLQHVVDAVPDDQTRVRQRFRDAFEPAYTRIIVVDAADVGSVALRPDGDAFWLEHLYIGASHQGRGVGSRVLAMILDDDGLYRLNVLQGSPARSLYERHGFVVDSQDDVDVFMTRERTGRAVAHPRRPLS